jgi:hypothetical protein
VVSGTTETVSRGFRRHPDNPQGTVIVAVPVTPSLVAVTVALPGTRAVTSPSAETIATLGAVLLHTTRRSLRGAPPASVGVAFSCTLLPAGTSVLLGVTVTAATAGYTVMVATPLFPSLVAVMVAVPVATARITPEVDTVATLGVPLTHVTRRQSSSPAVFEMVAVNAMVSPAATANESGVTLTRLTGTSAATVLSTAPRHPAAIRTPHAIIHHRPQSRR